MTSLEEIAHIATVPIDIEVQLDHQRMTLSDILALDEGSVVEMRRSAGENIDILFGNRLAAFGEIVIIESQMGVRITDFNTEH